MKLSFFMSLIALCVFVSSSATAQGADTTQHLGDVVISASRVAQPAATLTQAVTVISGDDLRARGVTRVSDALREVPGASLVQSGSYGAVTSLFLRGGESRYTKVLIDGVPVNAPGGFFDFSHLTTDNVERIEVVRGPASVLYGADAVSGIVQIFTRKAKSGRNASIGARAGTYNSVDLDSDASVSLGAVSLTAGAARHSTDGILPFNNQYSNGTLSSAIGVGHGESGQLTVTSRYTAAEFHYPTDFTGAPVDTNSYRTQHRLTVGLDAFRNLAANVQARFVAGDNDVHDLTEDIATPFGATSPQHSAARSIGYRRNADARVAFFLPDNATLTIGGGYEQEHEHSTNLAGPVGGQQSQTDSFDATRHNLAYYSELLGTVKDRVAYTVSGRVDDNSEYDRFATYRLGGNVALLPEVRLRVSVSSAFNAPAFNQLQPTPYTTGSPGLRPERSTSTEIGVIAANASGSVAAAGSYFAQRFSDLIQYVNGKAPDFRGSYANLTGATANGYEGEVTLLPATNMRVRGSFTVVTPKVKEISPAYQGSDQVGDELIRRATHSGSAEVSYLFQRGSLSGAVNYVGRRADIDFAQFPSPRVTLPSYTRVDIAGEAPPLRLGNAKIGLNARVENLFNHRHEEVLHFPAPGRTVLVGLRASDIF